MAQTLSLPNFELRNRIAQASLTQDIATGINSLPVGNSAGFTTGGPTIIGNLGSNTTELQTANSPTSSTAIPLSASTALPHNFNDFVTLLFGDQIRVYRADDTNGNGTQPPDANFSLLPGGTVNITANGSDTLFTDSTGTTGQWYKYTYYNSATQAETALSDSRAVQAGAIHYVSIDQVRRAAGLRTNPKITDDLIAEYRDAAEREVNGALQAVYSLPLPQPTNPIVVEITKNIAAGELMQEVYSPVSAQMVAMGESKSAKGRQGDGETVVGLAHLVDRSVVLQDANFAELTIDEAHGFGGNPDETTAYLPRSQGGDDGFHFTVDKIY